ncbi:MAG: DUF2934 domain-containing protein [Verrucomicrobia bacterium]|nr:DUF2934 domain-containing protein [Verrucomicrobiota bacterium]
MSRNPSPDIEPSAAQTLTEEEIAAHAYHLWIEDGRPEGRAEHHWTTAERTLRALMAASSTRRLIDEIPLPGGQDRLLS